MSKPTLPHKWWQPTPSFDKGWKQWWWPSIPDRVAARKVAREGFWAAVIVAIATALFAAFGVTGSLAFFDAALFGVMAVGIRKMSRAAAVASFVLFVFERALALPQQLQNPNVGSLFMSVALAVAFLNGARATFVFHKMAAGSSPEPSAPEGHSDANSGRVE